MSEQNADARISAFIGPEQNADTPLSAFIGAERWRYDDKDNNLFALSLGQAEGYYQFLLIILERHSSLSNEVVAALEKLQALATSSVRELSREEQEAFSHSNNLARLVQLETETYYLFAKIFLDKIALFVWDYFGHAKGLSLRSHDRMVKNIAHYSLAKGLRLPEGFEDGIRELKADVSDYRDKRISHLANPRTMRFVGYSRPTGETHILTTVLYPNEAEHNPVKSQNLHAVMGQIDEHVLRVIRLIIDNRVKTRFRLKPTP